MLQGVHERLLIFCLWLRPSDPIVKIGVRGVFILYHIRYMMNPKKYIIACWVTITTTKKNEQLYSIIKFFCNMLILLYLKNKDFFKYPIKSRTYIFIYKKT